MKAHGIRPWPQNVMCSPPLRNKHLHLTILLNTSQKFGLSLRFAMVVRRVTLENLRWGLSTLELVPILVKMTMQYVKFMENVLLKPSFTWLCNYKLIYPGKIIHTIQLNYHRINASLSKSFHWLLSASSVCRPGDVVGDIVQDDGEPAPYPPPRLLCLHSLLILRLLT